MLFRLEYYEYPCLFRVTKLLTLRKLLFTIVTMSFTQKCLELKQKWI